MHSTISKFQKFLIFICIFSFPLMGLVLSFAKLFPKFAANFSHSSMQIYTSSLVAVFFSISMGCFAHIIITTWKCAHDSYTLYMEETTQNTIIQQQTDLEQLQERISKHQNYIDQKLEEAYQYGQNGDYEKMAQLISSLSSRIKEKRPETFCKNPLLNTILQAKKTAAEKEHVACHFHILLPNNFDQAFPDITITSLFSNLLDNALEACRNLDSANSSRILELKTDFRGNTFMIHMKNSKNPQNIFTKKTTKKEQKILHGHGLSIIENIADKYNGTCNWEDHGDFFASTLMLQMPASQTGEEKTL